MKKTIGNFEFLTSLLISMGITPDKKGFAYLREAIILVALDPSYLQSVTKRLYVDLADIFFVKPQDVERCIRFAIGISYSNGGLLEINNLYGNVVYKNDYRPSNSEFIGVVADKISPYVKSASLA